MVGFRWLGGSWRLRYRRLRRKPVFVVALLALALVGALPFLPARSATGGADPASGAAGAVAQNSGAYTTSVPVTVPQFHGIEPALSLTYNSSASNSVIGMGWQIAGLSAIERVGPNRGASTGTTSDSYELDGEPLVVSTSLGGTHATMRQSYRRIRYDTVADVWTVTATNGVVSTYAARETHHGVNGSQTGRWLLSGVTDPYGNLVNYTYYCDTTVFVCYPAKITYNGTVISFVLENRPDKFTTALGGSQAMTRYRICTIDVTVSGVRARAYKLTYSTSPDTGRSLLASVREYGADATLDVFGQVVGGTAMPPTTLSYWSAPDLSFGTPQVALRSWCSAGTVTFGDFDGDNFVDLVCHNFATGNTSVAIGNGKGGFTNTGVWNADFCVGGLAMSLRAGDLDGDNRDDLVCYNYNNYRVALSFAKDGRRFVNAGLATLGGRADWCQFSYAKLRVEDVTADGKADIVCTEHAGRITAVSNGGTVFDTVEGDRNRYWCGGLSSPSDVGDVNGDGRLDVVCYDHVAHVIRTALFDSATMGYLSDRTRSVPASYCPDPLSDTYSWKSGLADLDGDGASDLYCNLRNRTSGLADFVVSLSLGDGHFAAPVRWGDGCDRGKAMGVADIDGDGRADVRCLDEASDNVAVALSRGNQLGAYRIWTANYGCQMVATKLMDVDFNDDGKSDLACFDENGMEFPPTSPNLVLDLAGKSLDMLHPDLLHSVLNDRGGLTIVSYTIPHTKARFGDRTPNGYHPAAVALVETLGGAKLSYTYGNASWDPGERRFLGYEWVRATDVDSGVSSAAYFRCLPGYPTNRQESVDVDNVDPGGPRYRLAYAWSETHAGGIYTSTLSAKTTMQIDPASFAALESRVDYTFDGYGNLTMKRESRQSGEAGVGRAELIKYSIDNVKYIVNTPLYVATYAMTALWTKVGQVNYAYDGFGQITTTTRVVDLATWTTVHTTASYDTYGNLDWFADEVNSQTRFSYDATYHVYPTARCQVSITPIRCKTQGWHVAQGTQSWLRDINGHTVSWQYDALGRRTRQISPDGGSTTTSYVNWGNRGAQYVQTSVSDGTPDGLWSRAYVDGLGRIYKTVAEPDITVVTEYNSQGQIARFSNPFRTGQPAVYTSYSYDSMGRWLTVTDPDGYQRTASYRVERNTSDADFVVPRFTVRECDENYVCRRQAYDSLGDSVLTSEWNGTTESRTRSAYNAQGLLTSVTDAIGNVSSFSWDSAGRKTSMRDPDAGLWSYTYDAASRLKTQTDPRNQKLTNAYDVLGRLTTQTIGTTVVVTNRYDEAGHGAGIGRMTSVVDSSGSTNWSYDSLGRITATVKTIGTNTYTVRQAYDLAGRRSSLTYPDGEVVGYTYDASGCLSKVGNYVTAATCAPTGDVATRALGNGARQSNVYDTNRTWLVSASTTNAAGTVLLSEVYSRRPNGQMSRKTSSDSADMWTYEYDGMGRLARANHSTTPAYSREYAYDAIGRMTWNSGMGAMAYPGANGGHAHAPSTVNGVAQTYDLAGNRTGDGTSTFGYDGLNRMTSVTSGGVTTWNLYDGQDRRVKTGSTVFIELDGQLLYQINGTASAKFYYYGAERVARKDSTGAVYYYLGTVLGSPHMILNSSAAVVAKSVYDPYGNLLNQTGSLADRFGLAGAYRDDSGLYKMGARYASAKTGSFASPDPSGIIDVAAPQSLNRYAYALNDPINLVDHTGFAPKPPAGGKKVEPPIGISGEYDPKTDVTTFTVNTRILTYTHVTRGNDGSKGSMTIEAGGSSKLGTLSFKGVTTYDESGEADSYQELTVGTTYTPGSGGKPIKAGADLRYSQVINGKPAAKLDLTVNGKGQGDNQFEKTFTYDGAPASPATDAIFGSPFENPFAVFALPSPGDFALEPINDWWNNGSTDDYFNDVWDSSPLTGGSFYEFWGWDDGRSDLGTAVNSWYPWLR